MDKQGLFFIFYDYLVFRFVIFFVGLGLSVFGLELGKWGLGEIDSINFIEFWGIFGKGWDSNDIVFTFRIIFGAVNEIKYGLFSNDTGCEING